MATSLITKKRIAKSFKKLLTEQAFEKISVRQIMEDAGIRRQTFYNHFLDKYESGIYLWLSAAARIAALF